MTLQRVNAQHVAKCSVSICIAELLLSRGTCFQSTFVFFTLTLSLQRLNTKRRGGIKFYKKCLILELFLWDASGVGSFVRGAVVQQREEESGSGIWRVRSIWCTFSSSVELLYKSAVNATSRTQKLRILEISGGADVVKASSRMGFNSLLLSGSFRIIHSPKEK